MFALGEAIVMKRYLVLIRRNGEYSIWSSYERLVDIESAMYDEFRDAEVGTEYVVLDTDGTGNSIVYTYRIERRVIRRDIGALEQAWPSEEAATAYPVRVGDGADLIRFVGK